MRRFSTIAVRAAVLVLACLAGCGGHSTLPAADSARGALEQAMNAWKSGAPPGDLSGGEHPVQAIDHAWRAGGKLDSFEILSEESNEDDHRFLVRRQLTGAKEPEEVTYVVFSRDPIRVYAEDDYQRLIQMDDNPAPRPTRRNRLRR